MTQVHVLERELTVERREVQELRADLEACKVEKRNIQRTLESTLDEKKQMTNRINELTIIGMVKILLLRFLSPFFLIGIARLLLSKMTSLK